MENDEPVAVQCALALDCALAITAVWAVPAVIDGWPGFALTAVLVVPLTMIGRGMRQRDTAAWFHQAALLVLVSLRAFWSYRPFGAVLTFTLLHVWAQKDVLAWFRLPQLSLVETPPAVAAATYLAAAEIGWLYTLEAPMFIGYHRGALAPFMGDHTPWVLMGLIFVAAVGGISRQRWAWLALPALLTPVLVASWPVHWALLLAPFWCGAGVREWFRLGAPRGLALAALAVPLFGFAAVQLEVPVGWCARHGWPLQLGRANDSPLIGRVTDALPEVAPDWEQLRVSCRLEEHAIALRPQREECERARTVMPDERGLPPCPLDRALRARGFRLPPHAFGPRARAGRLGCSTCAIVEPPEAP